MDMARTPVRAARKLNHLDFALHQAFVWTDVISTGTLAFGQRIKLAASGD